MSLKRKVGVSLAEVASNKSFKEVKFKLPPVDATTNRIIFAGLYPPKHSTDSRQHDNVTSRSIKAEFGLDHFDWVDLFFVSPDAKSSDVDGSKLESYVKAHPEQSEAWISRILARVAELQAFHHVPIVFICGQICKQVWSNHMKCDHAIVSQYLPYYLIITISDQPVHVVFGQHPSAHLTSGGNAEAISIFRENMALLRSLFSGDAIFSEEELRRQSHGNNACFELFGVYNWPFSTRELLKLPFEDTTCQEILRLVKENKLQTLLEVPAFCKRLLDLHFIDHVIRIVTDFKEKGFALFRVPTFCKCLGQSPQFIRDFDIMVKNVGEDAINLFQVPTFSKCADQSPGFIEKFDTFHEKMGQDAINLFQVPTFSKCSDQSAGFMEKFDTFHTKMGQDAVNLFQVPTFSKCVDESAGFIEKFDTFHEKLGQDAINLFQVPTFSRCADESVGFVEKFDTFHTKMGQDAVNLFQVPTFSKCVDESTSFIQKFDSILQKVGQDAIDLFQVPTFCNFVDKDPSFILKLYHIVETGSRDVGKLFQGASFCNSIREDPKFMSKLFDILEKIGPSGYKLFRVPAFCVNLQTPEFVTKFDEVLEVFGTQSAQLLFQEPSFCRQVQDVEFVANIQKVIKLVGQNAKRLFCPGVLNLLTSPNFLEHLCTFVAVLGPNIGSLLFSAPAFCQKVGNAEFVKLFYDMARQNGVPKTQVLFSRSSFLKIVQHDQFQIVSERLKAWFNVDHLHKLFSCVAFCDQILNVRFEARLMRVYEDVKEDVCAELFGSAFCKRAEDVVFWDKFLELKTKHTLAVAVSLVRHETFCEIIHSAKSLETIHTSLVRFKAALSANDQDRMSRLLKNKIVVDNLNNSRFLGEWVKFIAKYPAAEKMALTPGLVKKLLTGELCEGSFATRVQNDFDKYDKSTWLKLYMNRAYITNGETLRSSGILDSFTFEDQRDLCLSDGFCTNFGDLAESMIVWKAKIEKFVQRGIETQDEWKAKVNTTYIKLFQCDAFCRLERSKNYHEMFDSVANDTKYKFEMAMHFFSNTSFITNIDPKNWKKLQDKPPTHMELLTKMLAEFDTWDNDYGREPATLLFSSSEFVCRVRLPAFVQLFKEFEKQIQLPNTLRLFASSRFPAHLFALKLPHVNEQVKHIIFRADSVAIEAIVITYVTESNYDDYKAKLLEFESGEVARLGLE
jgi:hypothetical protein